ncbi:MAG: diaminopimelate epimerase [Bacillota bacterium]
MRFSKMNGLGNDYIYINLMREKVKNPIKLSQTLSNRHFGIGSDGLVLIDKAKDADFSMRMFNPDGSEGEMCGNAIRCVGKYVYEKGLTKKKRLTIATLAGNREIWLNTLGKKVESIKVDMGEAKIHKNDVPVIFEDDYLLESPINTSKGIVYISCVSVGNPHTVIVVDRYSDIDMEIGKEISNNPMFPNRTNVEFVKIINDMNAFVAVYERGTGETMACGTGATAAFYIANRLGKLKDRAVIHLKGGKLLLEQKEKRLFMTGSADYNYEGEIFL